MKFITIYDDMIKYYSLKTKETSIFTIEQRFKNNILPFFKNYNIEDITPKIYTEWQNYINSKNYKSSYKNILHNEMIRFYNFANMYYNYNLNIPQKCGKFKNDYITEKRNIWTIKELKKFLSVIENKKESLFFELLFFTGCRPGELMALQWKNVYKNRIYIEYTITKRFVNNKRILQNPKTRSSKDFVIIDKFLYKKLLKLKKEESKKEYFSDDSFVFNNNNKPFSHTTIERHKNDYCKKANVYQIQLKEFRHSHATNIFYISHDIELVKKRLRHSSARITLETYTHFLDKNKREQKALFYLRFFN